MNLHKPSYIKKETNAGTKISAHVYRKFTAFFLFSVFISSLFIVNQAQASAENGHPLCVAGAVLENVSLDCQGARIGLSCNGDDESQPPVLTLHNASVKNLIIKADGGSDGIHCLSGDCTLENVIWEDICEDAASLKDEGKSLTIKGGWAFNSLNGVGGKPDKIFQHNAPPHSTLTITDNFTAKGYHGKLWRSCGGCKNNAGPRNLVIDNVRIEGHINAIAGANVNDGYSDTVKVNNLFIANYRAGKPKICLAFQGKKKGESEGDSKKIGEQWNTPSCQVTPEDIISFSVVK